MSAGARAWDQLRATARETGRDVQALAVSYAIERFMERLSRLDPEGRIAVKGGQSLGILLGNQMRPTRDLDIDVAGRRDDADALAAEAVAAVRAAALDGADDGLSVDAGAIEVERREHQGDGGLRIHVPASVHTCRANFTVDVGLANEMTFEPIRLLVAGILAGRRNAPPPLDVVVYPVENTFAEKLLSKVEDGAASIRHKDWFDLWLLVETGRRLGDLSLLSRQGPDVTQGEAALAREVVARLADGTLLSMPERGFDAACLGRLSLALSRSAAHRRTELPEDLPDFLEEEFSGNRLQSAQFANWCRNNAARLLFQPPGTRPGEDRALALATVVGNLLPELGEIALGATDGAPRPR